MHKKHIIIPPHIRHMRQDHSTKLNWLLNTAKKIRLEKENNQISEEEAKKQLDFIIHHNSASFIEKILFFIKRNKKAAH